MENTRQRRSLAVALTLTAMMAAAGGVIGWLAQSAGVLADALDMWSDASAYAVALVAIGRGAGFKRLAARMSGGLLLLMGIGVLAETVRRGFFGSEPASGWMFASAVLTLSVHLTVLRLLRPLRRGEVHLRAAWIITRADVVANVGVLLAAVLVALTASRFPDLIVGFLIGAYVIRESIVVVRDAGTFGKRARKAVPGP